MKKLKKILPIILFVFLLSGCGNQITQEQYDENTENTENTNDSLSNINNEKSISDNDYISQLDIKEYSYENTIGDTLYYIVVTNNSMDTLEIGTNSTAYDAEGNLIGAADGSESAIASGETAIITNYFDGVSGAEKFEYTIYAEKDDWNESAYKDLEIEESRTNEKVIVSITNKGDKPAKFVTLQGLFFKEGKLVYSDSTYVTDNDSEIKSGATLSGEVSYYKGYDDVIIVVHGRK